VHEFSTIETLSRHFGDNVAFHVFSRVLWDFSFLQTQALELSRQEGKYFDMWKSQFTRQKRGGLGLSELESIFEELHMDRQGLSTRLEGVRGVVEAQRARAIAAGIKVTPSIFINGMGVETHSIDEASLKKLIDEALAKIRQG
jgi:protein-disulfide isomerase